ncbi:WhiB family transcriptional regulator [Actinoplanes campanulatus]|uniref:WhiB family transcriptional regulator n=1 Tax=Actinoplanes campanulatus TaxID=113559 RepID=UPI001944AF0A|nr:WhiB family transcriptional regulator [Actinoplanes campanulatus]GID40645.1 hypothetical protein Aca09nite_71510 [Actinoplanes campanulatus]
MTGRREFNDPGWPAFAYQPDIACRDVDPETFFPRHAGAMNTIEIAAAVRICRQCPHITACRDWATETRQRHGVWGGTTPEQREKAKRKKPGPAVHLARYGQDLTDCCGWPPAELPHRDGHRLTARPDKATCPAIVPIATEEDA